MKLSGCADWSTKGGIRVGQQNRSPSAPGCDLKKEVMKMLGEGIVRNIIDEMLERMRELETTKVPIWFMVFRCLKLLP